LDKPPPPYLTLVDPQTDPQYEEFLPLPYYPWDERPSHLPLDADEVATAIHLAHGDLHDAAQLLKTPLHRVERLARNSPRLQKVLQESLNLTLIRAASIPIRTLFDPTADARRLEWASTKLLQSKLAQSHPLSPAPAANIQSNSLTVNAPQRTIVFKWQDPDPDE
jgi:hypothetical protein